MRNRLGIAALRVLFATLLAAMMLLIAAPCTSAQQRGQIALTGGVATDQRGVRSNAVTVAPSLIMQSDGGATFSLGANLTQFQQQGSAYSLGGWGGVAARNKLAGPLFLLFDASGTGSRLNADRSSASFLTADGTPSLELAIGSVSLFGGAHLAAGRVSQDVSRPFFPGLGRGPTTVESVTRRGAGPTFGGEFTTIAGASVLRLGAREDRMRIESVTVADQALTATIGKQALSLSGSVGRRIASDEHDSFGGAALSLGLDRRGDVALHVAAGRYPSNRLTGSLAGKYLNAGFSFRFAGGGVGTETQVPGPRARGAPGIPPGYVRLTIDAPGASEVEVAGDFNEWKPVRAERARNGVWYADLVIKPGQYRYAFRLNGKEWRVPRGATAVDDGFGGKSAWLTVRSS